MIASDSQAMGRVGEVITRTWQTAHKMKTQFGSLSGDPAQHDNGRVKRYIAKYGINPAIAHGISHEVGSIKVGLLADLVLWDPAFFGVKPKLIVKGGLINAALMETRTHQYRRRNPCTTAICSAASGVHATKPV